MNVEHLVQMANQISQFFESEPVREDAIKGVYDHLTRFWDPRMRSAMIAHLSGGGEGLRDIARAAVERLAEKSRAVKTPVARAGTAAG